MTYFMSHLHNLTKYFESMISEERLVLSQHYHFSLQYCNFCGNCSNSQSTSEITFFFPFALGNLSQIILINASAIVLGSRNNHLTYTVLENLSLNRQKKIS